MVPALLVTYVAAYFVGTALGSALGLEEGDMLTEAGAWGVLAAVCLVAVMAAPEVAGIVLGFKARRLGERRLGTTGVVVNAALAAFLLIPSVVSLVIA